MFLRLVHLMAPYKWWIALAVLLGSATVASGISLMATSAYLVAAAALHPSVAELAVAIVGVRFFGIARGVFRYLERYVSHTVTLRLLGRWRVWFYKALEPLAPARLYQLQSGDLLARAVGDVETLQDFYVRVIAPPAVALVIASGMTVWLWGFSPSLAIVLLGSWLVTGLFVPLLVRNLSRGPAVRSAETRAALNARLVDGIQGMADLVAYGQQARMSQAVEAGSRDYAAAQTRLAWTNALQSALGTLLANLTMVVMLVLAIGLVNAGHMNALYLAAIALATAASFEAVLPLPQAAQSLSNALAAAQRLLAIVDAKPPVQDPAHPAPRPPDFQLDVRDLGFAYQPGVPNALDGITFSAEPGRHIAIVGPSGAGKTTLVHLLLRFWEYGRGEIRLGGTPLRLLSQSDVRRTVGVISQQTYLFNASIRDNLLLANPGADSDHVVQAARRAQIHKLIQSLPEGYDTLVGERGFRLSGGERQRLAIARALLRETPILILDEPTANLDPATEREFLAELFALLSDRTLLLITHRLIALDKMDEILVLDRGRIVERGTEPELLARRGLYHRLWTLQNQALRIV